MVFTLGELARRLPAELRGDPARVVRAVRPLATAGPADLSFLVDARRRGAALTTAAGAVVVGRGIDIPGRDLLVSERPELAVAAALELFHPVEPPSPGVHPSAVVETGCRVDPSATVGPYVVLGEGTEVGAGAVLHPGVVVGRGCRIGAAAVLHPRVVLYDLTEVGARVIVHAGAVLGSDGFRFVPAPEGLRKVPQVGRVVVEDDVEIGANSTVDRAAFEETRIGAGTKLDNLVQVGHNVRIGRSCILAGQAGVAGSAVLGDGVVMGGQSGVGDHVELGAGAQVAAKSAALRAVGAGQKVAGIPAGELASWRRQALALARLPELIRRVRRLERRGSAETEGS